MKKLWQQLKPQERRWVIGVGIFVFLVLQWIFVFPKFKEWGRNSARMETADNNMAKYEREIKNKSIYERRIREITESGEKNVASEDEAIQFVNFYQDRALENGVGIPHASGVITRTNDEFFVEREANLQVQASESNLVNFLYSLGSSNSMVRVRSMSLHAIEPTRYQLDANLKIVASYQRKAQPATAAKPAATTAKPAPTPAPTSQPAPKPTGQPAPKPAGQTNKPPVIGPKTTPAPTITTNKPGPSKIK